MIKMFAFFSHTYEDDEPSCKKQIDNVSYVETIVQSLEQKQLLLEKQNNQIVSLVQSLAQSASITEKQNQQSNSLTALTQSLLEKQIVLEKQVEEQHTTIKTLHERLTMSENMIHTLQTVQVDDRKEDRWTNPQNTYCKKVVDADNKDCTCLDCILHDRFTSPATYSNVRGFCPFGTNCTCLNANHRSRYKHLIQYYISTGRDTELSPLQVFYCTENFQIKKYTTKKIVVITPNIRTGNPYEQIVNCTKKDGIDVYQYVGIGNIVYDATEHELYYTDLDPTTNSHSIEKAIQNVP
jgi:hypothetical protein